MYVLSCVCCPFTYKSLYDRILLMWTSLHIFYVDIWFLISGILCTYIVYNQCSICEVLNVNGALLFDFLCLVPRWEPELPARGSTVAALQSISAINQSINQSENQSINKCWCFNSGCLCSTKRENQNKIWFLRGRTCLGSASLRPLGYRKNRKVIFLMAIFNLLTFSFYGKLFSSYS